MQRYLKELCKEIIKYSGAPHKLNNIYKFNEVKKCYTVLP